MGGITGPFPASMLLARIKADGTLDGSFAPGGAVQISGTGFANALVPSPTAGSLSSAPAAPTEARRRRCRSWAPARRASSASRTSARTPSPRGGTLKCDPGDVGAGATFTSYWPQVEDPTTGVLAGLEFETFESNAGKSYQCVVFPRLAGRAFGRLTSDNAGTVVAKGADTARSAVRKLKRAKRGVVKLTVRLKQGGTIKVTAKGFKYTKKLGKGTRTLKLKLGKKTKKLTIALTQGTVTTKVTKKIKR